MTFQRFLRWCVEKIVELHLAVAALLCVKFFMPVSPASYTTWQAFTQGVSETWQSSIDDASYMAQTYLGGSYISYALQTYVAAVYVVVFYFYLSGLYVLISLFIAMVSRRNYTMRALVGYGISCVFLCLMWAPVADVQNMCFAAVLFVMGIAVVALSARLGETRDKPVKRKAKPAKPAASGTRRVSLDLGA